jgi:hypothetical protein
MAATDPEAAKHWAVLLSVCGLLKGLTDEMLDDAVKGKPADG